MAHTDTEQLTSPSRRTSHLTPRPPRRCPKRIGACLVFSSTLLLPVASVADEVIKTYPPSPALIVDMQGLDTVGGQHVFTNPFLPPLSTSQDHRIGLARKVTDSMARFHVIAPEKLNAPFLQAGNGPTTLAPQTSDQDVATSHFFSGSGKIAYFALCDPTRNLDTVPPVAGARLNGNGTPIHEF